MAKVFFGSGDAYRVLGNNTTIYGVAGDPTDSVLIESSARGVAVNANVDRVDFDGSMANFTFRAGFGANMEVFAADGTTLLVTIPLQGDVDGTQLVFADGGIDAIYGGGAIRLGGVSLTGTANAVSPAASMINATVTTNVGVTTHTPSSSKVFLESGDKYREINDGATIYGVAGDSTDRIIIESGVRGVSVNANIDRVDFSGSLADFTFRAGFGANMEVYAPNGSTLLAIVPLQGDADGTQLVFANGGVDAIYDGGAIRVGGVSLTGTANAVSPAASMIDASVTTGAGATTINVSAANNGETYAALSTSAETFNIGNSASYNYSISGFELGTDVIKMPSGATIDNSALDGKASLQWAADGVVVGVTVTGLTDAQDHLLTTKAGWGSSWFFDATTINVSSANNGDTYAALSTSTETFNIGNAASYNYSISGFELGTDVIKMPSGVTIDNSALDGKASLQWAADGVVVGVTVTGLTDAQDIQLTEKSGWGNSLVVADGTEGTGKTVSADIGTIGSPQTLDASGDSFIFTENANVQNNVVIKGFSTDDVINVSNASDGNYFFSKDGADVSIVYNNASASVSNIIQLSDVVSANDLIYDEASFEAAIGFNAFVLVSDGTENTTKVVSSAGTSSAGNGDVTFNITSGTYTHNIADFGAGDVLDFPAGISASVTQDSFSDGVIDLSWAANGHVMTIHLTGISAANDIQLNSVSDFNTVFGAGTII